MTLNRQNGISTLIACQNEEALIGWSLLSFLDFSDEIIVVDNGSTDDTKEIASAIARENSGKIRFFDAPNLKDLHENRQFALEKSRFKWIVRGDSDYVCYTTGPYAAVNLREHLLSQRWNSFRPQIYRLVQPNTYLDFWHTGDDFHSADAQGRKVGGIVGRKRLPIIAPAMPRIYHHWPGFSFARLGRSEGVRIGRLAKRLVRYVDWPTPIWMHCTVKSNLNLLYRSERTNWRKLGDFNRFPTLDSYLREKVLNHFRTDDLEIAAQQYVSENVLCDVRPYNEDEHYPYPGLVKRAMIENPVFKIVRNEEQSPVLRRVSEPGPREYFSASFTI